MNGLSDTGGTVDTDILDRLFGLSDRMTISKAVLFFERHSLPVTRTMIQNYIRVGVLPPPAANRYYTKNHLIMILLIDHMKSVYSLDEIRRILAPVADPAFTGAKPDMFEVYRVFCGFYNEKALALSEGVKTEDGHLFGELSVAAESIACKHAVTGGRGDAKNHAL